MQVLRDWRYITPLLGLAVITALAAVLAASSKGEVGAVAPPTATAAAPEATATSAPGATATTDLGDVLLDSRRKLDLAALRDALATYHTRFRSYPSTNSAFQTACVNSNDALCALNGIASRLSFNDGKRPYIYKSDGATYTLYSEVAAAPSPGCFAELPPDLAGNQVYCVYSQGGGQ